MSDFLNKTSHICTNGKDSSASKFWLKKPSEEDRMWIGALSGLFSIAMSNKKDKCFGDFIELYYDRSKKDPRYKYTAAPGIEITWAGNTPKSIDNECGITAIQELATDSVIKAAMCDPKGYHVFSDTLKTWVTSLEQQCKLLHPHNNLNININHVFNQYFISFLTNFQQILMKQIQMPSCLHHQQPIAEITLINSPTEELELFCSKCPKSQYGSIEIVQILDRLSKLQISEESNVENYLNFLSNRINAIKQEFLMAIENFSKQVKDQIKFFKQQIITPETINYYSTIQQLTSEDLKQLSTIFALNFQMDNRSFSYHKTNTIIQQQIIILHNKIKKVNQLKIQIENSFNPDYQTQSSIQTDEEDCFNEKPVGYKNYIENDRIEYSQQIRGIGFSADNQYVFAHSHELPLTAFKIVNNKLTAYQKLEQKSQCISSITCSKMINRIYVISDKYFEVYEENQQHLWTHLQQFDMLQTIHLIQVSISEMIALTFKNMVMLWPQQGDQERNKISLPQKHTKVIRDISFNYNSSLLITASEDIFIIWKIGNQNQIEVSQCFEDQSIIYAQFSDSVENIICAVNRFGSRSFWKPDIQGLFYEAQANYTSSSTFGCTIKFRLNSKLIILGNHSIQLFEEDQQNDNEWVVKQQIKVNCWNLDVSKDTKYIVADDFRNLCLFVREE